MDYDIDKVSFEFMGKPVVPVNSKELVQTYMRKKDSYDNRLVINEVEVHDLDISLTLENSDLLDELRNRGYLL